MIEPPNIFNRIPADVWWTIFLETKDPNPRAVPSHSQSPLNLALVCTSWKNQVYNIPALWSALHVRLSPRITKKRIKSTHLWLARAKSRPLTLSIDMLDLSNTKSPALHQILLPYLDRLRNLRLYAFDQHVFYPFLAAEDKFMPLLESAEFLIKKKFQDLDFEMNFDGSPLFRSLKMSMDNMSSSRLMAHMPVGQLTELYVVDDGMCSKELCKLLLACTNLVHCTVSTLHVNCWEEWAENEVVPESVTLPHLESFRLLCTCIPNWNMPHKFIRKLICPSLKLLDLRLSSEYSNSCFPWGVLYTSLYEFQIRSRCPLESLSVPCTTLAKTAGYNFASVLDFFNTIPTLTSLHLVIHYLSSFAGEFDPLEHLVLPIDCKTLPNLSNLHLEMIVNPEFSLTLEDLSSSKIILIEIVSHMILSRCPPSLGLNEQQSLKSVKLAGCFTDDHDEDDDDMSQMMDDLIHTMEQTLRDNAPGLMVDFVEKVEEIDWLDF